MLLKPEGHDDMPPLRYDEVVALTILAAENVISEQDWSHMTLETGVPFCEECFIGMVERLAERKYITHYGSFDSLGSCWMLTEMGLRLFGDDFKEFSPPSGRL
jgi:hypothetical protein